MEKMNLIGLNEETRKITVDLASDEHTYNLVTTTMILRFGPFHKGKIYTVQKQQRQGQENRPGVWFWNDHGKTRSLWQLAHQEFGLSLQSAFERMSEDKQKDLTNETLQKKLKRPAYEQEQKWQANFNSVKDIFQ